MCERGVWVWLRGGEGCWRVSGESAVVGSPKSERGCEWVECAGVAAGWRGTGARRAGDQRSSVRRGRRGGASGVCGCDCGVAKSGGAQGGGSAVISSPRSEKGTEGRAVGEGVVWYRAYGVSRHLPASQGRGCPGEPGSVTPLPFLFHTCLCPLLRAAPSSRLSPCLGGAAGCGCEVRCECACLSATA